MNYKSILFFLGIYSLFVSFFSFLNILYSIYFNYIVDINSYIICLITSFFIGILFIYAGYKEIKNISLVDQFILIILSFLFLPFLICFPYFFSEYNFNFINSYFESISGFTTTGFSIIDDQVENLNAPLLLWRSSSQWLGGLFFLVASIGTLGSKQARINPSHLIPDSGNGGNFYNNFNHNFIKILSIYFFITIFIIFLFSVFNLRLLDSFNLALTVISAGGFLPTNSLSNIIKSDSQTLILSIVLLFPIINFYLIFKILTKKFKLSEHYEDLHLLIIILFLTLFFYFFVLEEQKAVDIFLSITSSISTSGINLFSYKNLDTSLFFILLTIIGGSVMSTSSGFKYLRFYILLKISYHEICRLAKPINVYNKNLFRSESKIEDVDAKIAFLIFITFFIGIFVLASILTLDNVSFENSFKLSILRMTNTVASSLYGINNLNFIDLNNFTKISLIFFMILGKIELIAILFLIKKFIFRE